MSSNLSERRLMIERKKWRKDHPYGFFAKPIRNTDGSMNLYKWQCGVPGRENTPWAGGNYKVTLEFPRNYPTKPPVVRFEPGFFHVNVYPDGKVCLSIINENEGWKAGITVKQILLGVQDLLNTPNPRSPANQKASAALRRGQSYYNQGIKTMVRKYRSDL